MTRMCLCGIHEKPSVWSSYGHRTPISCELTPYNGKCRPYVRRVRYREDKGHGHWYSSVFRNEGVESFLEKILQQPEKSAVPTRFTITVTSPAESGALHGWRIEELASPGR